MPIEKDELREMLDAYDATAEKRLKEKWDALTQRYKENAEGESRARAQWESGMEEKFGSFLQQEQRRSGFDAAKSESWEKVIEERVDVYKKCVDSKLTKSAIQFSGFEIDKTEPSGILSGKSSISSLRILVPRPEQVDTH
jgi:hypothetical protein